MKCPHCQDGIHADFSWGDIGYVGEEAGTPTRWGVQKMQCPSCDKAIISLRKIFHPGLDEAFEQWHVYPRNAVRPAAAQEVPPELTSDFNEAGAVLPHSPKASAALSRRCLQQLLRLQGFAHKDLAPAIQALLDSKTLPSWLSDNVDAIRAIGNFAAHPMKDTNSGAILEVEPEEAEWNLEVLEGLFDFYYVQPAKDAARRAAFNAKLTAAGKPLIK